MTPKTQPMKFETERLKGGPITHELKAMPEVLDLLEDPEYVFEEPVVGTLTAQLIGATVLLRGNVKTVAKAACGRCLEDIRIPLQAEVTLAYMNDDRLLDAKNFPELVDDDTHWYDGEFIYPAEQLRELLLLELPAIPACELDENNICPVRGVKVTLPSFGPPEEAKKEDESDDDSFQAKLKRMRKDLKGE